MHSLVYNAVTVVVKKMRFNVGQGREFIFAPSINQKGDIGALRHACFNLFFYSSNIIHSSANSMPGIVFFTGDIVGTKIETRQLCLLCYIS